MWKFSEIFHNKNRVLIWRRQNQLFDKRKCEIKSRDGSEKIYKHNRGEDVEKLKQENATSYGGIITTIKEIYEGKIGQNVIESVE